jgi:hypothetical protein
VSQMEEVSIKKGSTWSKQLLRYRRMDRDRVMINFNRVRATPPTQLLGAVD